ncbi:hypothetical protein HC776_00760 [bacterium]|nr:hypothetical protein [bacterium]
MTDGEPNQNSDTERDKGQAAKHANGPRETKWQVERDHERVGRAVVGRPADWPRLGHDGIVEIRGGHLRLLQQKFPEALADFGENEGDIILITDGLPTQGIQCPGRARGDPRRPAGELPAPVHRRANCPSVPIQKNRCNLALSPTSGSISWRAERALGEVDVFIGHSLGGGAGAWSVRDFGFRPKLFIALESDFHVGEHGPPPVVLISRFSEFMPLLRSMLKTQTNAQVVFSPWSEHITACYDPGLVNAGVKAACAAFGKPVPAAPTAWRWRLLGLLLGITGGLGLDVLPP